MLHASMRSLAVPHCGSTWGQRRRQPARSNERASLRASLTESDIRGEETGRRSLLGGAGAACLATIFAPRSSAAENACLQASTSGSGTEYDSFASSYDTLNDGDVAEAFGLPELRRSLLSRARGDVLEIGIGTGINLPLYKFSPSGVTSLTGLDISVGMLGEAGQRAAALSLCGGDGAGSRVRFVQGDATQLPFPDGSFDCVVDTFSMCVLNDLATAALKEMGRVVKPGGSILLLEHSRSGFAPLGAYQDLTAAAVAASGKGCFWNHDIEGAVAAAGLRVTSSTPALGGLLRTITVGRA